MVRQHRAECRFRQTTSRRCTTETAHELSIVAALLSLACIVRGIINLIVLMESLLTGMAVYQTELYLIRYK